MYVAVPGVLCHSTCLMTMTSNNSECPLIQRSPEFHNTTGIKFDIVMLRTLEDEVVVLTGGGTGIGQSGVEIFSGTMPFLLASRILSRLSELI